MIINSFGTIISHNPINRISIFLARVKNNYRKCIVFGMKILFETRRDDFVRSLGEFFEYGSYGFFFFFQKPTLERKTLLGEFSLGETYSRPYIVRAQYRLTGVQEYGYFVPRLNFYLLDCTRTCLFPHNNHVRPIQRMKGEEGEGARGL